MKPTAKRSRGRPRKLDRATAPLAALRVFRERGYDRATLADLQEAMGGISAPSVYAAFGSKEALFEAAVDAYLQSIAEPAGRALTAPASTTRDAIEQMLRANAAAITRVGEPRGCMLVLGAINCGVEGSDGVRASQCLQRIRASTHAAIAARIERGIREGDVPPATHVASLALFVTTVLHGLSIEARDGASRAALNAAIDHAMRAWDATARGARDGA